MQTGRVLSMAGGSDVSPVTAVALASHYHSANSVGREQNVMIVALEELSGFTATRCQLLLDN